MIKPFLYTLLAIFFSISVHAQTTISGKVNNAASGEPLPGVNVYLSGTTIGASTDNEGVFRFSTDIIGRQDLVASFIGFKTQITSIELGEQSTIEHFFSIEPAVLELNEINVVASNNEFLKQLELFTTFFIGFDSNADKTKIINPEILDFDVHENKDRITVSASAPLIIENHALGYIYEVALREVYFNPNDNTGLYKIYPRIIEMEPQNRRMQRSWNANRKESYAGSGRHFFKSLTEDKLWRNKFRVYPSERVFVNYSDSLRQMKNWYPNNWEYITENFEVYKLNADFVRIDYIRTQNTGVGVNVIPEKISGFEVQGFPEIFVVNNQGLLLNSQKIALYGDWSNTRFSDFLPLDYND